MSTMYSIGAINQLADALENAGFTPDEITKLKQFKELGKVRDILSGKALITYPENIIDCDAQPFIPDGWKVEEHKKGGQLKFDPAKFFLYLSKKQKKGTITGNDLRKELSNQSVMNANVLDYLLTHTELIPEEWKGKYIFFWGTIYRDSDGRRYVRCLGWYGSEWSWNCRWLDFGFGSDNPAALAS